MVCTAICEIRAQCHYKCTAIYGAPAPIDGARTAKIADTTLRRLDTHIYIHISWSYFLYNMHATKIISNDLSTTVITSLVNSVTLYVLNIKYVSCDYVLLYDKT